LSDFQSLPGERRKKKGREEEGEEEGRGERAGSARVRRAFRLKTPFTTSVPPLSLGPFLPPFLWGQQRVCTHAQTKKRAEVEKEKERERGTEGARERNRGEGRGEEEEEVSEKETHRQQEKRKGEGEGRGGERVLVIAPFLVPFPVPPRSFLFAVTVYGFPFTRFHSLSFPPHTFLCALSPPSDLLLVFFFFFFFFLLFFIFFFSCKCFLPWLPIGFGPFFFHSPYPSLPLSLHSTPQRTLFSRVPPSLPSLSLSLSLSPLVFLGSFFWPPPPPPSCRPIFPCSPVPFP